MGVVGYRASVWRGVVLGADPGQHIRLRVTSDAASGTAARHRSCGIFTVWTPLSASSYGVFLPACIPSAIALYALYWF